MTTFFAYLLRCSDGSFYVGHTENSEVRLAQHASGELGGYTSTRRPVQLAWSAPFYSRDEAFAAEQQIKKWSRAKKDALARGDMAALHELAKRRTPDRERK